MCWWCRSCAIVRGWRLSGWWLAPCGVLLRSRLGRRPAIHPSIQEDGDRSKQRRHATHDTDAKVRFRFGSVLLNRLDVVSSSFIFTRPPEGGTEKSEGSCNCCRHYFGVGGVHSSCHQQSARGRTTIDPPSHLYNAGTERAGFLPTKADIACTKREAPWGVRRVT